MTFSNLIVCWWTPYLLMHLSQHKNAYIVCEHNPKACEASKLQLSHSTAAMSRRSVQISETIQTVQQPGEGMRLKFHPDVSV